MKPPAFKFFAPNTVEEALTLLETHGSEAKLLAGGQSLIPTMNFRLAAPEVLIDLNRVNDLDFIRQDDGNLHIGAMTRQRAVERSDVVSKLQPLLFETMPYIAHPQIRNRGTIGGSLVHADPAAELPAIALALKARFKIVNKTGERWVDANDFYTGMFGTAVEEHELLTEVMFPKSTESSGTAFKEIARRHGDYAMAGVAAVVGVDAAGQCDAARVVFLSVSDAPLLMENACKALLGTNLSAAEVDAAADIAANQDADPVGDIHASAEYRRHLVKVLFSDVVQVAAERARA